jgi:hypothetical protein
LIRCTFERRESRAKAQHDILIKSLEKVARDADDENEGWKIKLLIFVRGTSRSVNVKTFNENMQELQVIESKRNDIRKGLAFELLNATDAVLCSYFAQRTEARGDHQVQIGNGTETFQGLAILNYKLICRVVLLFILGLNLGGVGPLRGLRGGGRRGWCEEWARSG